MVRGVLGVLGVRGVLGAGCVVLQVLQRHQAHDDEQRAAEHFAAALDVRRDRPPEQHDQPGAGAEEQRVAGGEAHGDAERPRTRPSTVLRAGASTLITRIAVHRQRRDGHQVIGAETVQEAQEQGGEKQQQA